MATAYEVKLGRLKGVNAAADQLTTMSLSTSTQVDEGSFLYADWSESADKLKLATPNTSGGTPVEYLLLERVTSDGPTFTERQFRVDVGEKKSGRPCAVIALKPGMQIETATVATSGTGALSSGTALETALSVISGELVIKQASGSDGDTEVARLKENRLGTDGFIIVHVTNVGSGEPA